MATVTPMLAQYREIKSKYPDAILFYRMGDFYEMFFEDALIAAPILEVQLTARDKAATDPIPMCGVPYHAVSQYLPKLLAKGKKVALCEQVEDPATAKGLVKREVTRVVTPSLIGDPDLVPEHTQNFLASIVSSQNQVEVCCLELLSSSSKWGVFESTLEFLDWLEACAPKEILIASAEQDATWFHAMEERHLFPTVSIRDAFFEPKDEKQTWEALKAYLAETQKLTELTTLSEPQPLIDSLTLHLDFTSAHALEITRSLSSDEGPTLLSTLNRTQTAMGARLLKDWLLRPSTDKKKIVGRHEAVEELFKKGELAGELKKTLGLIRDLERLATKTALGLALPRDLTAIRSIQKLIPDLKRYLEKTRAPLLKKICKSLDPLTELTAHLERALEDEVPATLRDGGIFRNTFHPEIAELRNLSQDAKGTISRMEVREKERTGISSLKIKYSKVFGYTIEITNSHLKKVPREYIRKQTIANGERYITEELKGFEEKAITAESRLKSLEENLFYQLRAKVSEAAHLLLENAQRVAELDVLVNFASVARDKNFTRPKMHDGWNLSIRDGRHPMVEDLLPAGAYVPNSVYFREDDQRTLLITGPNMGGKSTIMRQVAQIVCLAQAGSFVPAKEATLPIVDAIYTRIGSSDDLARGRSTFMVEMNEVGRILERATPRSLVLIDEIGRGTSTYDGLSLAWSLLEFLHITVKAKTLFATHFHELTQLEKALSGLKNVNVLVEKTADGILFLYRLADGACSKSYGIEVAKLAGLPPKLLLRAREILGHLETHSHRASRARGRALEIHDNQMAFLEVDSPPESLTGLDL